MTNEAILDLLKFALPVVALFSALWSTTQKITVDQDDGGKRLTLQGRVMIGAVMLSTLISLLSLGFETVIGKQRKQEQAIKAARDLSADNAEKARIAAEAQSREQAAALARLEADAAERQRFLKQELLIISNAAEAQRRDARIASRLATDSNQRVIEATRAFAEFDRINYPLRGIAAEVELSLNFDGIDLTRFWIDLARNENLPSRLNFRGASADERTVSFKPIDVRNDLIIREMAGISVLLRFAGRNAAAGPGVSVALELERIDGDLSNKTLKAYYSGSFVPETEGIVSGGIKLSLADIDKLTPTFRVRRDSLDPAVVRRPDLIRQLSVLVNGQGRYSARPEAVVDKHYTHQFALDPR